MFISSCDFSWFLMIFLCISKCSLIYNDFHCFYHDHLGPLIARGDGDDGGDDDGDWNLHNSTWPHPFPIKPGASQFRWRRTLRSVLVFFRRTPRTWWQSQDLAGCKACAGKTLHVLCATTGLLITNPITVWARPSGVRFRLFWFILRLTAAPSAWNAIQHGVLIGFWVLSKTYGWRDENDLMEKNNMELWRWRLQWWATKKNWRYLFLVYKAANQKKK